MRRLTHELRKDNASAQTVIDAVSRVPFADQASPVQLLNVLLHALCVVSSEDDRRARAILLDGFDDLI